MLFDTWEGEDDELETALDKLTQDLVIYETKYLKIACENDETIERCKSILLASKPKVSNRTQEILRESHANISNGEDLYYYVHDKIDVQSNDNAHLGSNVHDKIE